MTDLPAIRKLAGTVETIVKLAEGIPHYNDAQLNQAENKLRNEFQVLEAHQFYVGQEFYRLAQARRQELRRQSVADATEQINAINKPKEEDGARDSGRNGDTGVGNGTNESSGVEREGDKQTRKSAGRTRRKK